MKHCQLRDLRRYIRRFHLPTGSWPREFREDNVEIACSDGNSTFVSDGIIEAPFGVMTSRMGELNLNVPLWRPTIEFEVQGA